MLVSEKIGGLPLLSSVFDYGIQWAAIIVIIADFGIICALMWLESLSGGPGPTQRTHYKTFLWNDTIFIPLYMIVATVALQDAPKFSGFYTQVWWHILVLVAGFVISIVIEYGAVKGGQYTMSQELSPSKLWHTFIFSIVFYWLVASLTPVMLAMADRPVLFALFLIALIGFGANMFRDAMSPLPKDAHLEGSWSNWDWHRRQY